MRKGLKGIIEFDQKMQVIGEAEDGLEAIKMAEELKPNLVVMDIALPKLNGIEASRQIVKTNLKMKILILSAYSDCGYIDKVRSLGLSGYLLKQCTPNSLLTAIEMIYNGGEFFSPVISKRMQQMHQVEQSQIQNESSYMKNIVELSPREIQVLQLVALGSANKQIANDLGISIKTVEKHRQNLMNKLSIHDTAGLTRYAIEEGIIESSIQGKLL